MSSHDASGSALGYLFQVKWALLELIRGTVTRPDQTLTLESLDDVAWQSADGDVTELLQLKHHVKGAGDLSDMSPDIWRTLKVWMDDVRFLDSNGPILTLVTTGSAPNGAAAYFLRPEGRDEDRALGLLNTAASESSSNTTARARDAWLRLTETQRRGVLRRVRIIDKSSSIVDVDFLVRKAMGVAPPVGFENVYLAQIWSWWFKVSVDLLSKRRAQVDGLTFHRVASSIRDQFTPENLPTTVKENSEYDAAELLGAHEGRAFVHQLRWVGLRQRQIEKAVLEYHRSVTQTTDWVDGNLLQMRELDVFKERLIDEWENSFDDMMNRLGSDATDEQMKDAGRELYNLLRDSQTVQVRDRYTDVFYARGTRCEIADGRTHGWHPDFDNLLRAITSGSTTSRTLGV